MRGYRLYDYIDYRGVNQFENWTKGLDKGYRGRLNRKLKALEDNEPDLLPGLISGPITGHAHIYKIKLGGRLALRPLLCKGPINNKSELTLLMGAVEKGFRWEPRNAPETAERLRQEIIDNPQRRCDHVKVL